MRCMTKKLLKGLVSLQSSDQPIRLRVFTSSNMIRESLLTSLNAQILKCYNTLKQPYDETTSVDNTKEIDFCKEVEKLKIEEQSISLLDPAPKQDMSFLKRNLPPTFNLAAYANVSSTIQNLMKLGMNLYKFDSQPDVAEFLLRLDFEKNIQPHIRFLCDYGVPPEVLGKLFTQNPLIFKERLDDLQVRVNYLESKKFTKEMISRILSSNAHWLMFPVERIDSRLGYFQVTYKLSGDQVRLLASTAPKLITYKLAHIKLITFVLKEEMGFDDRQIKKLLLNKPKIFRNNQAALLSRFEYVHNNMQIPSSQILEDAVILTYRTFKIQQRHMFLQFLGRAQYNPKMPGYISLTKLVTGDDAEFCKDVAKSSIHSFNMFLKTI